jgi:hypothetical protein
VIELASGHAINAITGEIAEGGPMTRDQVIQLIRQTAEAEGIPPDVAVAVAQQESGFNPMAVGDGGHSHGIFQENDMGRAYGRAPDYDVVRQTQRFAEEFREVAAANPGADLATLAYLAQRPADRQGYIRSISAILGSGASGGGKLASPMANTWIPKGPIKKLVPVGTQYQVIYEDETIPPEMVDKAQIDTPEGDDERNTVTATTAANIAANRASQASSQGFTGQQNALDRAQNAFQFKETFDVEKAKFNIRQQFDQAIQKWNEARDARDFDAMQFWARRADEFDQQRVEAENANRDVSRGQTLLSLGSRPETLGRSLYALQGQQAPQGFDFGTSALPGFGPNAQNPTVPGLGQSATAGPIPGLPGQPAPIASPVMNPTAAGGVDPRVAATMAALNTPGASLQQFIAPLSAGDIPTAPATEEQLRQQALLEASGRKPRGTVNGVSFYEKGGPIPEPVIGLGLLSGERYMFGEKGKETVVPEGKTLAEVKGKKGKRKSGVRGFATGGTLGLTPAQLAEMQASIAASAAWNSQQQPGVAPTTAAPGQTSVYAPTAPSVMTPSTIGGNPTQAQTAMIGGVQVWAGGPYSGLPVAQYPQGGNLTPYLQNPSLPAPAGATMPNPAIANTSATPAAGSLPGLPNIPGNTGGMRGAATQSRSVFKPGQLGQYLSGQFLRPGIPNFPQYQQATGGTSLLSNARWMNQATPSELGLYKGFLQDEAGIPPEDALALAGRMAPQGGMLRTPGYGRSY